MASGQHQKRPTFQFWRESAQLLDNWPRTPMLRTSLGKPFNKVCVMVSPFDPSIEQLPAVLPIFPLPGALLLPRGNLPLNIFEPRYVAMINAALKTDTRMIGMIQPADAEGDPSPQNLCRVGCAGRISSFSETDDGRFMLQLTGVIRFSVDREIEMESGFRRVFPNYERFHNDLMPTPDMEGIDRDTLMAATKNYFEANSYDTDWDALEKTSVLTLVTSLAMACPFDVMEKQALLEAENPVDRAAVLTSLLQMGAAAGMGEDGDGDISLN